MLLFGGGALADRREDSGEAVEEAALGVAGV